MTWKTATVLALAAAVFTSCSSAGTSRAPKPEISPQSLPQKIAVVRIERCFDVKLSKEAKDAETEESKLHKSLDEETKELEREVKKEADILKVCPAGSKAQEEHEEKYELAKAGLQVHITFAAKQIERTRERSRTMLLKSARDAACEIAAEMDFGLVLSYAEAASDGPALYANPAWDITDKVVERMNKDYK